jgi:hypothetical protein
VTVTVEITVAYGEGLRHRTDRAICSPIGTIHGRLGCPVGLIGVPAIIDDGRRPAPYLESWTLGPAEISRASRGARPAVTPAGLGDLAGERAVCRPR